MNNFNDMDQARIYVYRESHHVVTTLTSLWRICCEFVASLLRISNEFVANLWRICGEFVANLSALTAGGVGSRGGGW